MHHDTIVISGGGSLGIMLLGAIQSCVDKKIIDFNVLNMYVGTSVGSIVSYLIIIGFTPIDIVLIIVKYSKLFNKMMSEFNIVKMINMEGAVSFHTLKEILEEITFNKTGRSVFTMKGLYKHFNKELICVTYNYTKRQTEYISHYNYPDLPCILALQMSCSLPFIFEKCIYNDNWYLDGGIVDNLAIQYPFECGRVWPIVFNIEYTTNKIDNSENNNVAENNINFMFTLLNIVAESVIHYKCGIFQNKSRVINIQPNTVCPKIWKLNTNVVDILSMFSHGYSSVNEKNK